MELSASADSEPPRGVHDRLVGLGYLRGGERPCIHDGTLLVSGNKAGDGKTSAFTLSQRSN